MKKALALVLALAMVFALCACGSTSTASTETTTAATTETTSTTTETTTEAAPANDGKVYSIDIDYPNPESSSAYKALVDWADYLREETDGRLDITIYSGGALGSLFDCVSNCESGVTDGFWSGVTIYAGVFPITEVFGLPMLGAKNYKVINAAMNDMLAEYTEMSDEWSQFKVVALHSSAGSPILFKDTISSIEDMAGYNLRISNAYTTQWFTDLGAAPVSCGINDGYENIQKSVIDGGLFFFDQVESSALYEVIDSLYVGQTIYPLNMLCLNKDVYESLPADLQQAIDESGEFFLEDSIQYFDEQQERMIGVCEDNDVTIIYEDDDSVEFLSKDAPNAWAKWVDTMNGLGYDGQDILDTAIEYINQYNETLG